MLPSKRTHSWSEEDGLGHRKRHWSQLSSSVRGILPYLAAAPYRWVAHGNSRARLEAVAFLLTFIWLFTLRCTFHHVAKSSFSTITSGYVEFLIDFTECSNGMSSWRRRPNFQYLLLRRQKCQSPHIKGWFIHNVFPPEKSRHNVLQFRPAGL